MNISSNFSSIVTPSSLDIAALRPKPAADTPLAGSGAAPLKVTQTERLKVDKNAQLDALRAQLRLGQDLEGIGRALVPVMKEVMQERPDLAHAKFDFVSENGAINVVSDAMSDEDIAWLEGTLNDDVALVATVEKFHESMVGIFVNHAKGIGKPLAEEQVVQAHKEVDGLVSFMDFMGDLASAVQRGVNSDRAGGAYVGADGSKDLGLAQDPTSAAGFVSFMGHVESMGNEGITYEYRNGKTDAPWRLDAFLKAGNELPSFLPGTAPASLGFHEQA